MKNSRKTSIVVSENDSAERAPTHDLEATFEAGSVIAPILKRATFRLSTGGLVAAVFVVAVVHGCW